MPKPKELTRADILGAARRLRWTRKMPKWTVIVEARELPARPLVLEAAGVPPNDPTNSHQAVAILQSLGFETRYAAGRREDAGSAGEEPPLETSEETGSIADMFSAIAKDVPEADWLRVPADLSKNVDHYLYGSKKTGK